MNNYTQKKMIVCDMDGTLAESKQAIDREMIGLVESILEHYSLALASGGGLDQFKQQFLSHLSLTIAQEAHLYLLPTSGAALFTVRDTIPIPIYQILLTEEEIEIITRSIHEAITELEYPTETIYGPLIEARGSQVTYSALGQQAPFMLKSEWDPDLLKRRALRELLETKLPDFQVSIGGATSLDITRKSINKAYGIMKLSEFTGIQIIDMVYVGDALYSGGNDTVVQATGIDCHPVSTVADSKLLFRSLLGAV